MTNHVTRDPADLRQHPDNPRGVIDHNSPEIERLAEDIAKHGILQPIVITSDGTIIAGHRRHTAALRLGLTQVPVMVRDLQSDEYVEEIFLSENVQRQDLSALEEAKAISAVKKKLEKRTKAEVTFKELSRCLNIPSTTIRLRLCILELSPRIQQLYHQGDLPLASPAQLCRMLQWPEEIEKIADKMVTRQITQASLDTIITRRMHELQQADDNEKILARDEKLKRIKKAHPETHRTPPLTRAVAYENLSSKMPGSISIASIKSVLDTTCCTCGMLGNEPVCLSCPLPRFVNGLAGRADSKSGGRFDE